ncbi:MAG TPA: hypothetical protein VMI34_10975 [Candidatus Bathyarchaeia archaeon]|nr:hypothetical protein [Candidatus Bathyarchaeia archaeon]
MAHTVRGWPQRGRTAAAGLLMVAAGLLVTSAPAMADSEKPAAAPSIFELTKPQVPNANKGMSDAVRESILMPSVPPVQEWVLQPDGSMKNTRTGITMALKNVCAPGDLEHEAALDAFRRAQAGNKNRLR